LEHRFTANLEMTAQAHKTKIGPRDRWHALLLILTFALPFAQLPIAAFSNPEAMLPACCRSHGKHHCMMSADQMEALQRGHHFTVVNERCPLFPQASLASPHHGFALAHSTPRDAITSSNPIAQRQVDSLVITEQEGAHYKRGPPSVRLS